MVLSPSAGSNQRFTGLKCSAKVSVPSGAAAAALGPSDARRAPRARIRARAPPMNGPLPFPLPRAGEREDGLLAGDGLDRVAGDRDHPVELSLGDDERRGE